MGKQEKNSLVKREEMQASSPFAEMEKYVEKLFGHPFPFFSHPLIPASLLAQMKVPAPSVDIFEEGNEVVVKAEIPGMKKEDIEVSITEDSLTISGEKKQEEKIEKKEYHRIERSYGSFRRCFSLPDGVDGEKASASFKEGILEIRLPKTKASKRKAIAVS